MRRILGLALAAVLGLAGAARATGALSIGLAVQVKVHCKRISEEQAVLAKEFEELANLHEAEAKDAKRPKPYPARSRCAPQNQFVAGTAALSIGS